MRGLTTAAGIWMVATIGMAVGVGMYLVSVVATGLMLVILVLLEQWSTASMSDGRDTHSAHTHRSDSQGYRSLPPLSVGTEYHTDQCVCGYDFEKRPARASIWWCFAKNTTDFVKVFGHCADNLIPHRASRSPII